MIIPPFPPPGPAPWTVEVWRGDLIESRHRVHAALVDHHGRLMAHWGDVTSAVYPRSAVKPIQALPLLASGAAKAFGLNDAELAIASGSHRGRADQVLLVERWLARLGLNAGHLACGPQWPADEQALRELSSAGAAATALYNNCSGQHAGMLTLALHLKAPLKNYVRMDHPVQRLVNAAIEACSHVVLARQPAGIDGCSLPTLALPLAALARAFAELGQPATLDLGLHGGAAAIIRAMTSHPEMVEGQGRFPTDAMAAARGQLIVKSGGEGVMACALPKPGLGLALKAEDGAGRAATVAAAEALLHLDQWDRPAQDVLRAHARPELINRAGIAIGRIALQNT